MTDHANPRSLNLLFVCSKNQWRSPTAEQLFARHPLLCCRSRGTASSARRLIQINDVTWAEVIMVMEHKHKAFIQRQFTNIVGDTPVLVLDIPDEYGYMDAELVAWLSSAVPAQLASLGFALDDNAVNSYAVNNYAVDSALDNYLDN